MSTKKLKQMKAAARPEKKQTPEEQQEKIIAMREAFSEMMVTEPLLAAKLTEAIEAGRFFITVTFLKKYRPADKDDLHHFYCRKAIEPNDCIGSIRHIKNDFIAKEMPHAALDKGEGWH